MDEKDHDIAHFHILTTKRKLAEFRANWQFAMDRSAYHHVNGPNRFKQWSFYGETISAYDLKTTPVPMLS